MHKVLKTAVNQAKRGSGFRLAKCEDSDSFEAMDDGCGPDGISAAC